MPSQPAIGCHFPGRRSALADVRGDARFVAGVARIAARVAEMRKRVDLSDLERWSGKFWE